MVAATRARSRKRWIRAKRMPYGRDQFSPTRRPEGRWFESSRPDHFPHTAATIFISHVDVTRIKEYHEEAEKLAGEASLGLFAT